MASLNRAIIIGRLGKDPEIKDLNNGKRIANLSVATSERWKDKNSGEMKEATEWHRVVVFNEGLAKVVQNHVRKGDQIYIEGQIKTRKWTDSKGTERYSTEIVLSNFDSKIVLLGSSRKPGEDREEEQEARKPQAESYGAADDKIPF